MHALTIMSLLGQMSTPRLQALFAQDARRAADWVFVAALEGLPQAQLCYGRMLLEGTARPRDPVQALKWFRRAASSGETDAINMVGRCLDNGWGTPEDPAAAAEHFLRAANAGHAWAQYNLGHLYLDGRGLTRDRARAYRWYSQAAQQGHARAMNLVGRCYDQGWGVGRDPALARTWYRRSAEAGYFRGQYNHASCLAAQGRTNEALKWLDAACKAATPDSLAVMARELEQQSDPQLSALGRRFSRKLTPPHPPRNGAPR